MTDFDDVDKVQARKNQEDPIIMYLIVRENLGMSIGKTAAQCAHASQMLQLKFNKLENLERVERLVDADYDRIDIFKKWLDGSFRKVVLRASDKEFNKIKSELMDHIVEVIDAGLTEIAPNTSTVLGVWPIKKSEAPKIIKKLQVLK